MQLSFNLTSHSATVTTLSIPWISCFVPAALQIGPVSNRQWCDIDFQQGEEANQDSLFRDEWYATVWSKQSEGSPGCEPWIGCRMVKSCRCARSCWSTWRGILLLNWCKPVDVFKTRRSTPLTSLWPKHPRCWWCCSFYFIRFSGGLQA